MTNKTIKTIKLCIIEHYSSTEGREKMQYSYTFI